MNHVIARAQASLVAAAVAAAMLLGPSPALAQSASSARTPQDTSWVVPTGIFGGPPGTLGTQPTPPAPFVPVLTETGSL